MIAILDRTPFVKASSSALLVVLALAAVPAAAVELKLSGQGLFFSTGRNGQGMQLSETVGSGYELGPGTLWDMHTWLEIRTETGFGHGTFEFTRVGERMAGTLAVAGHEQDGHWHLNAGYNLAEMSGTWSGWTGVASSSLALTYLAANGWTYVENGTATLTPVPEPSTSGLMLAGLALVAAYRFKRCAGGC